VRRTRLLLSCAIALNVCCTLKASAADPTYPQRPIRLIIPQSPGGASDTVGRIVAQKLSERLGQQIVADNRPGATGNIGAELVAHAAGDGYTMLLTAPNLVTSPSLYARVGFDPVKDFAPVSQLATSPNVWLVHPSFAAKSMKELIAVAKSKPRQIDFSFAGKQRHGTHLAQIHAYRVIRVDGFLDGLNRRELFFLDVFRVEIIWLIVERETQGLRRFSEELIFLCEIVHSI
jgi:tripartite-type tricarboxylate transporter receptor subunit TctC